MNNDVNFIEDAGILQENVAKLITEFYSKYNFVQGFDLSVQIGKTDIKEGAHIWIDDVNLKITI